MVQETFIKKLGSNQSMEIYEPAEDSRFLQKFVRKYAYGRVLDVGTGSGIQALTAVGCPNVKEVIAVDVNKKAVEELHRKIKENKLKNIKAIKSDLFDKVVGKFNVIVFNPPYLPQDEGIKDTAIYGGKKGWEISERFFSQVSKHLLPGGIVLLIFSSLTNKNKIDEIISHHLFEFKEIGKSKIFFEELFVYAVAKTTLLRKLESKGIGTVHYFAHGKRGNVYAGFFNKDKLIGSKLAKIPFPSPRNFIKVAIKVKRTESRAVERIKNETKWLRILNKKGIGSKLLFSTHDCLVYEFVEGDFILNWVRKNRKGKIKKVLGSILKQCFILDKLKINKEEMHHPMKHIIVNKDDKPTLIDFERCHETDKPRNVTQFIEFICRIKHELKEKGIKVDVKELREAARKYKRKSVSWKTIKEIIKNS